MPLTPELVQELNLLVKFPMHSDMEGIKVNHDASSEMISAAQRLYDKGLVTQPDGGYLTSSGHQALEHAKSALRILSGKVNV
ncbi:TIGR02647 family protein [Photobacterium sp. WH77]|uniref:TIGR02647 family protein n=1 Tax=Photobacterium arenosum TaxID=2774143 RepID=A0ABR9BJC3_9GAMM|nr:MULTISPECIES: TIGR02647 family protein [Photobacterium]MBD8512284.1 TIGR02647 family protein [Photobacterium arenosum]MBV7260645.1 TIGR02647 family protein [Photobacterium sp. WH24]MCG2835755.1 TIGR02647 family protein [Photobacterium sp. WH77]MCG2843568.1 TIGR02647 family protein [Photobacterium sp. WH80]MDO6579793.1 TIGR02647 family protein [Photobacterium sp. 2_MG-2023]